MSTPTPPPPSAPDAPRRRWPLLGGASPAEIATTTAHLLLDLPVAIVAFVVTVVLGALSVGLLVIYPVGLALLVGWIVACRGLAGFERWRIRTLLGVTIPAPATPGADEAWHARIWTTVRDRATWRSFAYHLVRLPLGVLCFAVTVAAWAVPIALLTLPAALVGADLTQLTIRTAAPLVAAPLVGLALVPLSSLAVHALGRFDAALAATMLGPSDRDRLDHRVEQLRSTRSDLVDIAEQERRRIERDLHDGAGQQLVSLAMTLGMAREKLRHDPTSAQGLIDEAHAEAKQALVGLRDIVRGISPAILTDRGLGAALSAVAARSTLPVSLVVEVPERPDAVIEGIAYYVVCEALSNAVRHADATHVRVSIVRHDDVLEIEVRDDGRGGADPARGTGLRGLAGRVAAVDGELEASSPAGGPTVIRAALPARTGDESTVGH